MDRSRDRLRDNPRGISIAGGLFVAFLIGLFLSNIGGRPNEMPWDWDYPLWKIIWIGLFSLNGAALGYCEKNFDNILINERFNLFFFIKTLVSLFGILLIIVGANHIHNEEFFTKLSSIEGKGAIFIGALEVLFGAVLVGLVLVLSFFAWYTAKKDAGRIDSEDL